MTKSIVPEDSVHQIGLNTFRKKNIMMEEEFYEWRFKNCGNGYIFTYIRRIYIDLSIFESLRNYLYLFILKFSNYKIYQKISIYILSSLNYLEI